MSVYLIGATNCMLSGILRHTQRRSQFHGKMPRIFQAFVNAIIEYIYDLTDRYEEFKSRLAKQQAKK